VENGERTGQRYVKGGNVRGVRRRAVAEGSKFIGVARETRTYRTVCREKKGGENYVRFSMMGVQWGAPPRKNQNANGKGASTGEEITRIVAGRERERPAFNKTQGRVSGIVEP